MPPLRVAEQYDKLFSSWRPVFTFTFAISSGNRVVDGVLLTPREYECLQWAARRKSAWDIACILGIKPRTAAFHLDNAKKKPA